MNLNVKGIVIKEVDYKDSDKIITILTDCMGKISVKARGARKKNSRLTASTQLYTYCDFQLFESGGKYVLDESDIITQFIAKSPDIVKIALASYFCEAVGAQTENNTEDDSLLRLLLNCLYALDHGLYSEKRIKSVFELKSAVLWGYRPLLSSKEELNREKIAVSLSDGALSSANIFKKGMLLSREALLAVNYICSADLKRVLAFNAQEEAENELSRFAEGYFLDKLGYKPKTLGFYESL